MRFNSSNIINILTPLLAASLAFQGCSSEEDNNQGGHSKAAVKAHYADMVLANYEDSLKSAMVLQTAIKTFTATPSAEGLAEAKEAWLKSRGPYGQAEAFRFYDGPIDHPETGPEGQLNAWPMDEVYVDYVEGDPDAGIINRRSIAITKKRLSSLNEGGDETVLELFPNAEADKAIATGYHAIEFLLWGQDFNEAAPGNRPWQDYLVGAEATAPNGDRRAQYLNVATELLVDDLTTLVAEWSKEDSNNYRNSIFLKQTPEQALILIIRSIGILAKSELAGERIDVALTNGEQEDEQSCFSDNTNNDIWANAQGIHNVYFGTYGDLKGPSLSDLVAAVDPALDQTIKADLDWVVTRSIALPLTFDQFITDPSSVGYKEANDIVVKLQIIGNNLVKAAKAIGLGSISVELPE